MPWLRSTAQKALSLIQIEELAISELESVYSTTDNPDEFITVKRMSRKESHQLDQERLAVPHNSPWSREL